MSTLLDFMFEDNGDLKDEFRRYPEPIDTGEGGSAVTNYPDGKSLLGLWHLRVKAWEDQNLGRIPDWEKARTFLEKNPTGEVIRGGRYRVNRHDGYLGGSKTRYSIEVPEGINLVLDDEHTATVVATFFQHIYNTAKLGIS